MLVFSLNFNHAHAYFTTSQKEIDLKNGSGLFLIDYAFGTKKHSIQLPIQASDTANKQSDTIEYAILDKDGNVARGKTSAIALSHAKISKNGYYAIDKSSVQRFTLAVFFTPETKDSGEYRLQVTSLPFTFDGTQQLQLNPSELQYYKTKLLSL